MISTTQSRYSIETLAASTRFSNPVGRAGCSSLILVVWICGWAVGEVFAGVEVLDGLIKFLGGGQTIFRSDWTFLLVWLLVWTAGGLIALYSLLWQVTGREVIEVSHESLKVAKKVFGLGFGKTYNAINIDNLRVDESLPQMATVMGQLPPALARFGQRSVSARGALMFDYGGSTVRFGLGLNLDEARQLLGEIQRRYPQYRPAAGS